MAWKLEIWWGYSSKCSCPVLEEEFEEKSDGVTRATEILTDGYTISTPGSHDFFPAASITHVDLHEFSEE
jgi:hypothetical protein